MRPKVSTASKPKTSESLTPPNGGVFVGGLVTDVSSKVQQIFLELVGSKAEVLRGDRFPSAICSVVGQALCDGDFSEASVLNNDQIALNIVDWNSDAAFLVAVHLFPKRFSSEEIKKSVWRLMLHVPDHLREAAQLMNLPTD